MKKDFRADQVAVSILVFIAIAGLLVFILQDIWVEYTPWSEVKEHISNDEVESVQVDGDVIRIFLKTDSGEGKILESVYIPDDETFFPLLDKHKVAFSSVPSSGCEKGSSWFFTLLIIAFLAYIILRPQQGSATNTSMNKSSASLANESESLTKFKDVAGIDEAIEELEELVDFLTSPQKFTLLGGKIPKGVLLVGPPGTGKTLLAKAVAGEANVPFFHCSGSDFVEIYVGVGAARVRDLFQKAKDKAPCIIFIDEIDAIGKTRGRNNFGGNEEREQTLNQLLVAMDGFDSQKGVILMAATNRPDALDQALLRPGRFDRQISVDRPDLKGREEILRVHARSIKLDPKLELKIVARMTAGFSGADLANALNEAALLAGRRNKSYIALGEIEEAIERTIAGLKKKNRRLNEKERRIVAVHEVGHALCAAACPNSDSVQKISIIPRGIAALGYTLQLPDEDRHLYSKQSLLERIIVLFGGRAAEEIIFSEITTGASDDIQKASSIARQMVKRYGMSDNIGAICFEEQQESYGYGGAVQTGFSQDTNEKLDGEIKQILNDSHTYARKVIDTNQELLQEMAARLLEIETLSGHELNSFLQRTVIPS